MFKIPNVRDVVSIVTVMPGLRLTVLKFPVLPAPSAITPPVHLVVSLQLPDVLELHVPLAAKIGRLVRQHRNATASAAATQPMPLRRLSRVVNFRSMEERAINEKLSQLL